MLRLSSGQKRVYNASIVSSLKDTVKRKSTGEGLFNFFVSQASAVITIIDKDGIILYQSPSVKRILGYDDKKRIGKSFLKSRLIHPEDIAVKEKLLEKSQKYPGKNFRDELRMKHNNGSWKWMEVTFNNQLNNPDVNGVIVITHDISERKSVELQKNEFLSIASHELKTPLTTIRAYGQLVITKLSKDPDKKAEMSFLEKIISQTDKITLLINELLDVSKIQEGRLTLHVVPFHLCYMVEKLIDDFHYIDGTHRIILTGSKNVLALGDENRIGQVIINLLTNAIKYSPKDSTITVDISKKNGYAVVSVADEGVGIVKSKQKYVFDRFFRIAESNAQQISSGLGLYIASEIIKLHKGKIWVESKKGKGSTFYFSVLVAKK